MSKKIITLLVLITAICLFFISPVSAAGGSGTVGDPFIIQTPAELQAIQDDLDAYYALGNDIDLTGITWTPIGNMTNSFNGSLEGNSYTISNLEMNVDAYIVKYIGLFGVISGNSYVANTTLNNFILTENQSHTGSYYIGCLAGSVDLDYSSTSTIYNVDIINSYLVDATPEISSSGSEGCLIGYVYATQSNINIRFCDVNNCNINIERRSGSLIGDLIVSTFATPTADASGYITNCNISNTIVTSGTYGGGLFGYMECWGGSGSEYSASLDVDTCIVYATDIISEYEGGGISGVIELGYADISITNCYVDSSNIICETDNAGGIFGRAEPDSNSIFTIDTCIVTSTNLSTTGWVVGGIGGCVYNSDLPNEFIVTNSFVGDCNITAYSDGSEWYLAAGVIGLYEGLESPTLENIYVQNNEINGYAAEEIITLLDYYTGEPTISLDATNVFGVGNLLNGYYHADLNEDTYLISVTDIGTAYSVTITPPDTESYNVSTHMLAQSTDYHTIGSTWLSKTGTYTYSLSKTYAATAGYIAIAKNNYSDYEYFGLPLYTYPIIITSLDVPETGNIGEGLSLSADAYNIESYQWQHSTDSVSWTNIDESWVATTVGNQYIRLKTDNTDFTAYSVPISFTIDPQKPTVSFSAVTPTNIAKGSSVSFEGQISILETDTLLSYTWNFGDGTTDSSTLAPTHTYANGGTYTVSLTAVSIYGTTTFTRTGYITVSSQEEFIKFENESYVAGETAKVSYYFLNADFSQHEYSIRIFAVDTLGQAYEAITPVKITSSSGSHDFDTTGWSGDYIGYIYQDSYIFIDSMAQTNVVSVHNLNIYITNNGETWTNYTVITVNDGISQIAEGNTTSGSYVFSIPTGTYTITATTEGKTPVTTTVLINSDDTLTFDWVTGASRGTDGAGSAYASTFVTFRVLDSKYGNPISGAIISTRGVAATNPFEWFANLFGTAWGSTILGTNQTGTSDDRGVVTFAMFPGVRYTLSISHPDLTRVVNQTFTPSALSAEYPIYLDIYTDTPDAATSITTLVTVNSSGIVSITYSDATRTTTKVEMNIYQQINETNYTKIDGKTSYANATTENFQLTDYSGTNIKIVVTSITSTFGTVERVFYHTFPGPLVDLGLPPSVYIWICLISAIVLGGVSTFVSSYMACFVICFIEWVYWFFGWFFEIGSVAAASLLVIATILSVVYYMSSRR